MEKSSHSLPPLAHEALAAVVPGLGEIVARGARAVRALPDWEETRTLAPSDLLGIDLVQDYLKSRGQHVYDGGATEAEAEAEANFLGQHLYYLLNFELHRRKVFWVDESLAWMLQQTQLDIDGRSLRLPFPSFACAFTGRATLEIAEALLQLDPTCHIRREHLQILTAYVTRAVAEKDVLAVNISLLFDARNGTWPYLLTRELYVRPGDHLEAILDSRLPDIRRTTLDPIFTSPELGRLVHLMVNSILYATSASDAWPVLESPIRRLRGSARGRGRKKQQRVENRVQEVRKERSGEDVFFLPGKIPISQFRRLREIERSGSGAKMMIRFMVRGHWRRPNPDWEEQHVRWIAPYWKGPDLATIVEREYRLKP